ncbi:MAG TPA: hypothetical protein PLV32_00490 [Chitinophagaceae bacterium]|nr:hypothetical protein [Chitinophagaceae bacterium]
MHLTEVSNNRSEQEFLDVNKIINSGNPNYIQPLDKDIKEVFNKKKNKAFRQGEAIRWILKDGEGRLIGRIAAFVNRKYRNKGDEGPVGGVGFFDCINDQAAADMLFDVAKHWLLQKGMTAMDGPINFGERDRWWGLLVQGFDPPVYCLNFNPPYYQELFENYGFKNYFNQVCFALKVGNRLQEKFYARHAECAKDPDLNAEHIQLNKLEKYAKDFTIVYNKAWAGHGGLKQMDEKVVLKLFRSMKPVMDERIIWFVYYKGEPIALWLNLPDLNQWFRHLHGKFGLLSKLKFLWIKKTKHCNKFVGLVFGVVPEWQGKGIDSYMIVEGARVVQGVTIQNGVYSIGKPIYEDYEMQWIGEFNPKMINVAESLGTYRSRILTTYRYLFDRTKPFQSHPILN